MILSTHIIVGGLIGGTSKNYFWAAMLALASHYLLDAIPHWDYLTAKFKDATSSNKKFFKEKYFWVDFLKIAIDIAIGIIVLFFLVRGKNLNYYQITIGVFFAILPDPLQFISWTFKLAPLRYTDKIQAMAHSLKEPGIVPGLLVQIVVVILSVALFWGFSSP